MSSPNISVPLVNGNATMKAPLAPSEKNANVALSINTESLSYTGQPSQSPPDGPGLRPRDAYDSLPWWRAAIRNKLLESLEWQSTVLANMQARVRTPWLDQYFVYTSSLGTHTFFMTGLPACFFFGYDQFGRGLLLVLALGVYVSSFAKDVACVPRPYAPPVTRLTFSNHHLEYGFPSTHSTNSISIALFIYTHVHRLASLPAPSTNLITTLAPPSDWSISPTTYWISTAFLAWYTFSIIYGRLYCAMHSFTDCALGAVMGAVIWAIYWVTEDAVENWLIHAGWSVPLLVIPISLIMVNQHPVPIDDCPCFEDAIAFVSVLMGSLLGRWHAVHYGFDASFFGTSMPGSAGSGWADRSMWWSVAAAKMIFGILIIFTWRIFAKSVLHMVLPPTFRLLAQAFTLPNRRFYTPATDYKNVPSELGLRPIPSVIDLPEHLAMEMEVDYITKASGLGFGVGETELKARSGKVNGNMPIRGYGTVYGVGNEKGNWELEKDGSGKGGVKEDATVKHYDADVLTKVVVYFGIALLACTWLPILFEVVGWGVKSW